MPYNKDQIDRLRLYRTENVGPVIFRQLLRKYGTAAAALDAIGPLSREGGRKKPLKPPSKNKVIAEIEYLKKIGGQFIFLGDEQYPKTLANISDPPPVIACLGHPHLLCEPQIAIVGARNSSGQARQMARQFAQALGEKYHYVITSGMARGIDGAAHKGALKTGTIAVLAGGVDHIYPTEHKELYQAIKQQGCIISEAPLKTAAQARHFPSRNRLIAGLGLGVLLIEAASKSGSLITARLAAEYGRDVFVVPGSPLDPRNRGGNQLLRDGAIFTETPEDIIPHLKPIDRLFEPQQKDSFKDAKPHASEQHKIDTNLRTRIFALISPNPCDIDIIIRDSEALTEQVITVLMELELAGKVERYPGNRIALSTQAVWDSHDRPF